jgi:hypothetical protein
LNSRVQRVLVFDFNTLVLLGEQCVSFPCLSLGVHSTGPDRPRCLRTNVTQGAADTAATRARHPPTRSSVAPAWPSGPSDPRGASRGAAAFLARWPVPRPKCLQRVESRPCHPAAPARGNDRFEAAAAYQSRDWLRCRPNSSAERPRLSGSLARLGSHRIHPQSSCNAHAERAL